jgi:hypothetical protein
VSLPLWLQSLIDELRSPALAAAAFGISLLMALASIIAIPWLLCRLPEDYLEPGAASVRHGMARRVLRNTLGSVLLVLGILMLVLPGQGLLTILVGLTLLDFPSKRRIVLRLLLRPRVFHLVNSIRDRFGRPPLRMPRD